MEPAIALLTFPDLATARQIGTALVEAQLVACINLLPGAESIYSWDGKLEREAEVLAIAKTALSQRAALEAFLRQHHPYHLPELLLLRVDQGGADYLNWVHSRLAPGS
ncbi:MAG: divalent-cation tolerance protein CutA [Verrucomicrobiota bacterium]